MVNIGVGLVMLALGLWGMSAWWWSVTEVLRGVVPILLIIIGPIAIGAGMTRLREQKSLNPVEPNGLDEING
ncbi:MAG: hypothetical protein H7839_10580 [Magnetococcus sp. YQC-5]